MSINICDSQFRIYELRVMLKVNLRNISRKYFKGPKHSLQALCNSCKCCVSVEGGGAEHQQNVSSTTPTTQQTVLAPDTLLPPRPGKPAHIQQASLRLLSVQGEGGLWPHNEYHRVS